MSWMSAFGFCRPKLDADWCWLVDAAVCISIDGDTLVGRMGVVVMSMALEETRDDDGDIDETNRGPRFNKKCRADDWPSCDIVVCWTSSLGTYRSVFVGWIKLKYLPLSFSVNFSLSRNCVLTDLDARSCLLSLSSSTGKSIRDESVSASNDGVASDVFSGCSFCESSIATDFGEICEIDLSACTA